MKKCGETYPVEFYVPDGLQRSEGLTGVQSHGQSVYSGKITFEPAETNYSVKQIKLFLLKSE